MVVDLKPKVEFKPFDKVLVRNTDTEEWFPGFFEKFDVILLLLFLAVMAFQETFFLVDDVEPSLHRLIVADTFRVVAFHDTFLRSTAFSISSLSLSFSASSACLWISFITMESSISFLIK